MTERWAERTLGSLAASRRCWKGKTDQLIWPAARHAAVALATEANIEPHDPLLRAVALTAAEVNVFNQKIKDLEPGG